jgi:hypothetical protein
MPESQHLQSTWSSAGNERNLQGSSAGGGHRNRSTSPATPQATTHPSSPRPLQLRGVTPSANFSPRLRTSTTIARPTPPWSSAATPWSKFGDSARTPPKRSSWSPSRNPSTSPGAPGVTSSTTAKGRRGRLVGGFGGGFASAIGESVAC